MKKILFVAFILFATSCFSQEEKEKRISYSIEFNGTFKQNENFGEYDYYTDETDCSLIAISAVFIRSGFNFKINDFFTTGFKFGFDFHEEPYVRALPYYIDTKFTISQDDDDKIFVSYGIGKLYKIAKNFERGNYFKIGAGYDISTEKSHKFILSLDFHQKNMPDLGKAKLQSFTLGFGMQFF